MKRSRRGWVLGAFTALVFLFLITPILVVFPLSFGAADYLEFPPRGFSMRWYETFFSAQKWLNAAVNSLRVGLIAALGALILGTLAAFGVVKMRGGKRTALYTLFIAPMVVPAIVMAVAFYFFLARLSIVRTELGVVLAHMTIGVPYVIANVVASLQGYDHNLTRAALSLGANPLTTFWKVTLPSIKPGLISGALFAFVTSFDEVVITRFIAPTRFKTLPMLMFEGIKNEIQPTIAAVATMLIAVSALVLVATQIMNNRRIAQHSGKDRQ